MPKKKEKRSPKRPARRRKANSSEVLGQIPRNERINPKWRRHFNRLIELRNHLLNRKQDLMKDAREEQPVFSLHMADAGTDHYDRDFALTMISAEQDALYEIEHALNRIRNGSYGICQLTGKRIEPERLNAIPWARFSAAAEKQLEKDGAVDRTRLAPVQQVPRPPVEAEEEPEED